VASVFRAAARQNAVLFFDEADAIAGRRFTSMGAAYEREANAIVNVLLHELETFPGVGPIVALTAKALPGDRERCLEAGCSDFATKPVEPETLVALLFKWTRPRGEGARRT